MNPEMLLCMDWKNWVGKNLMSACLSDNSADSMYIVMSLFMSGSPEPNTSPSGVVFMKRNLPMKMPSVHLSR